MPEISIIMEKKGEKSLKTNQNISHQDGKKRIFFENEGKLRILP